MRRDVKNAWVEYGNKLKSSSQKNDRISSLNGSRPPRIENIMASMGRGVSPRTANVIKNKKNITIEEEVNRIENRKDTIENIKNTNRNDTIENSIENIKDTIENGKNVIAKELTIIEKDKKKMNETDFVIEDDNIKKTNKTKKKRKKRKKKKVEHCWDRLQKKTYEKNRVQITSSEAKMIRNYLFNLQPKKVEAKVTKKAKTPSKKNKRDIRDFPYAKGNNIGPFQGELEEKLTKLNL